MFHLIKLLNLVIASISVSKWAGEDDIDNTLTNASLHINSYHLFPSEWYASQIIKLSISSTTSSKSGHSLKGKLPNSQNSSSMYLSIKRKEGGEWVFEPFTMYKWCEGYPPKNGLNFCGYNYCPG